ncbi:uroporphyrinogen-III synthase-like protein [Patellaria atrata CBS 101060]|uniref:Uroporphyrinogen-III synthase-like protein n=1 Tax=Patellaria atrata CBS 101060 TaxID=1346257 RepID=A0A9P4VJS8_9PEZI|nr:uroporphyrinogen-III synthase-like protein [Patellaria atrata CBS 101060]
MGDPLRVPILLLKTKSSPSDGYEEYLRALDCGRYDPQFVPVLEHRFKQDSLKHLRETITAPSNADITKGFVGFVDGKRWGRRSAQYGAIIFTSQRAVEAFTKVIQDLRLQQYKVDELLTQDTVFYAVGPATARGLRALGLKCPILGEETGNGQALAGFILEHYNGLNEVPDGVDGYKKGILFLVGEQRRDIIPKTLWSTELPERKRIIVTELEVYETGELAAFASTFSDILERNGEGEVPCQWVVVFSPTGCKAMLECLRWLDRDTGRAAQPAVEERKTYVITIGPTTRDFLLREFGFEPDVCAEKPSPEGVAEGISEFMKGMSL